MKKYRQTSIFILICILSINLVSGYRLHSKEKAEDDVESIRVFVDAISELRKGYVDKDKVTYKKLIYAAMRGMMDELDKPSRFHEPVENQQIREENEGQFAGIGVILDGEYKGLKFKYLIPNGPAEKSGIKAGDIVLAIDGLSIIGMKQKEIRAKIRGKEGSEVVLSIQRKGEEKTLSIPVVRGMVMVPSVRRAHVIDGSSIGYIYVSQFIHTTASDFEKAITKLRKDSAIDGLVIDLRGNPGGVLHGAVKMCSNFMKSGDLVVNIKKRDIRQSRKYFAEDGVKFDGLPVVVLVDGYSASASEILSSCLKDYSKAVLVGEKTYGKGSVQTIVDLRDGSSLRYTIAHYYTKSERKIDGVGIAVDIEVKLSEKERKEVYNGLMEYRAFKDDLILQDKKDLQLQAALNIFKDLKNSGEFRNAIGKSFEASKAELVQKYSRTKVAKAAQKETESEE